MYQSILSKLNMNYSISLDYRIDKLIENIAKIFKFINLK